MILVKGIPCVVQRSDISVISEPDRPDMVIGVIYRQFVVTMEAAVIFTLFFSHSFFRDKLLSQQLQLLRV